MDDLDKPNRVATPPLPPDTIPLATQVAGQDKPDRVATPPLPPDTIPLATQVAGHFYGKRNTKLGMLELKDGTLVKPLIPPKGDKELTFYKSIHEAGETDKDIHNLKHFLAKFYGTWSTPLHPDVLYLKLENITLKFSKPCVLDVKVGPITWSPSASEAKKLGEMNKYPPQRELGFRILGIKTYRESTGDFIQLNHLQMRDLQVEDILHKGFLVYFHPDESRAYKQGIINAFIRRVEKVKDWFSQQRSFHFYASSLLFIYEGQPKVTDTREFDDNLINFDELVDLRLIDFTHVFPANGERDENYLIGVTKLLQRLHEALEYRSV